MKNSSIVLFEVTLNIGLFGDESEFVDDFLRDLYLQTFSDIFEKYFYKLDTGLTYVQDCSYYDNLVTLRAYSLREIREADNIVLAYKALMRRKFNLDLIYSLYKRQDKIQRSNYLLDDIVSRYIRRYKKQLIKIA